MKTLSRPAPPKQTPPSAIYIRDLERALTSETTHRVTIRHGEKTGKLTIEYHGNADLERICGALRALGEGEDARVLAEV
jgi:hypothetical protein